MHILFMVVVATLVFLLVQYVSDALHIVCAGRFSRILPRLYDFVVDVLLYACLSAVVAFVCTTLILGWLYKVYGEVANFSAYKWEIAIILFLIILAWSIYSENLVGILLGKEDDGDN